MRLGSGPRGKRAIALLVDPAKVGELQLQSIYCRQQRFKASLIQQLFNGISPNVRFMYRPVYGWHQFKLSLERSQ